MIARSASLALCSMLGVAMRLPAADTGPNRISGRLMRTVEGSHRLGATDIVIGPSTSLCGSSVPLSDVVDSLDGFNVTAVVGDRTDGALAVDEVCPLNVASLQAPPVAFSSRVLLVERTTGGPGSRVILGLPQRVDLDQRSTLVLVLGSGGEFPKDCKLNITGLVSQAEGSGPGRTPQSFLSATLGPFQRDFSLLSPVDLRRGSITLDASFESPSTGQSEIRRVDVEPHYYGVRVDIQDSLAFVRSQLKSQYVPAPGLSVALGYSRRKGRAWNLIDPTVGVTIHLLDFDPATSVEIGLSITLGVGKGALILGWGKNISLDFAHKSYFFVGTSLQRIFEGLGRLKGRQKEWQ